MGFWMLDDAKKYVDTKLSFMKPKKNIFNKALSLTVGYLNSSGVVVGDSGFGVTGFIPVEPNTTYIRTENTSMGFYTAEKVKCSTLGYKGFDTGKDFTTPSDCVYIRTTLTRSNVNTFQIEEGTVQTQYEPYTEVLSPDYLLPITSDKLDKDCVTVNNISFMQSSKNLFRIDVALEGKYVNHVYGNLESDPAYYASDYISVEPSTQYTRNTVLHLAFYTASKVFISGLTYGSSNTITTPSNCAYVRVSVLKTGLYGYQFEKGPVRTAYESGYDKMPLDNMPSPVITANKIKLPPKIYAVVGRESNVYYDNLLVDDADKYQWSVNCNVGKQQDERFVVTPTVSGVESLIVQAFLNYETPIGYHESSLVVAPNTAGSGLNRSVLYIGDSKVAAGVRTSEVLAIADTDVMDVTLIGTKGTGLNKHEGISGWSVAQFYSDASSPFVFSGAFNFAQYMSANSFTGVDRVFIDLGTNDFFNAVSDITVQSIADSCITKLEAMIAQMITYNANIKIGYVLTIPPSRHQDAFANSYGNAGTQARWRFKRNVVLWVDRLISQFKGREAEGIYLVPSNVALDTEHNVNKGDATPWNSRTTETTQRQSNGVHPADSGYKQMADMEWAWLKSLES